jgi:cytochrome c553
MIDSSGLSGIGYGDATRRNSGIIARVFSGQLSGKISRMKIQIAIASAAVGMLLAGTASADGNAAAGKQKTTMCQGCHGIPGYKTAFPSVYNVPKLGGQHAGYIVKALQGYKSGERSHPSMRAIAAGLSDQDMADLGAYYAGEDVKTAGK